MRFTAANASRAFSGCTTNSISCSYIALRRKVRKTIPLRSPVPDPHGLTASSGSCLPGCDRSCHSWKFQTPFGFGLSSFSSSVLWSFGPLLRQLSSASTLLRPLLTSAGFSSDRSPRVNAGSFTSRRPALPNCLLMPSGFVVPSQLAPATRPLCQFVFLRSKFCLLLLSVWPRGFTLQFGYGCWHLLPQERFILIDPAHAGHTRRGL